MDVWAALKGSKPGTESPNRLMYEFKYVSNVMRKKIVQNTTSKICQHHYTNAIDVMEADWDNLVILDACRFDYFAQINDITGELYPVVSNASGTTEFIRKTFGGNQFHDTVCVSPNSKFSIHTNDGTFYKLINDFDYAPSQVLKAAENAAESFPDKRLIIHFMTPHTPYLGATAEKYQDFRDRLPYGSLLRACQYGYIPDEDIRKMYEENVNLALAHTETLYEKLRGKSVITADHGEYLGERISGIKYYGHATRVFAPHLRHVPWLVIDSRDRREIRSEQPIGRDTLTNEGIEQRLESLGYLDSANLKKE